MRSFKHLLVAMVAVAGLLLGGCGDDDTIVVVPYNGKFLYVNNDASPNFVSGFAIKSNGTLEHLAGSPFATGGAGGAAWYANNPIAIARSKKLLFAANEVDSTVTSFTINPNTGELTAVGVPVASGDLMGMGGSLAVDDEENFLFVGNSDGASISVFAIAANGALTAVAGSPFAIPTEAMELTLNSVGSTLYIGAGSSNVLVVMDVAADGTLTQVAGSPFALDTNSFAFISRTLAVGAAANSVISSYSIDTTTGVPTLLNTIDLGPANNQNISLARNKKLAVMAGGGSATISVVRVASDGTLTEVDGSPFATTFGTSGYAVATPLGTSLYATAGGFIEAFKMDSTGFLTSLNTYPLNNPGFATGLVIY